MSNFEIAKLRWKVAETAVKFLIIVGALMFNSQNFDKTEISALVMIALGWSGVEAVKQKTTSTGD